jgi:3'(2'), 5'-bisphosphate nucleotidase
MGAAVSDAYQSEAEFALRAVRAAAALCRRIQQEMPSPAIEKPDRSPVTVADFSSQALISHLLQRSFPQDILVAEENGAALQKHPLALAAVVNNLQPFITQADAKRVLSLLARGAQEPGLRFWALDPVDGTKGFLRGGHYVIALALLEDNQVKLGVLACPTLNASLHKSHAGPGVLLIAVHGQGAYLMGEQSNHRRRLAVSSQRQPSHARLLRSVESSHTDEAKLAQLTMHLGIQPRPTRMDSQAKYAVLAAGAADLLFRLPPAQQPHKAENIWDQAAGSILVEEAGGSVTDLLGRPLDFSTGRQLRNNMGVLASNAYLHPAALAALHAVYQGDV